MADFSVAAIARGNPELQEYPFALVRMAASSRQSGNSNGFKPAEYQPHSELSNVSPAARACGLRPGMTVAQARALIPDLIVTHASPAAERSAADALLDVAESMSPVIEEGMPGCVWLDLTGMETLYNFSGSVGSADAHAISSPDNSEQRENTIAAELIGRARRIGIEASAGIGSNKEIAHLAARCGGARVITEAREREFLDWLPLDLLQLDGAGRNDETELMLKRLGIRRLGDIARLDSRAVGSRLGRRGVELARLARGEGSATVIARPRIETFTEAAEFDYGIDNLEPLGFILYAMLKQLVERLKMRGWVAGDITISLVLADHRRDDRRVPVAAGTCEARSLLTLLKLELEKSPPLAAVEALSLTVESRALRPAQNDLFLPASPPPDRLEAAIARIAALCGPEHVGTPVPADSYRPEAIRLTKFTPPPPPAGKQDTPKVSDSTPIVLRTIRPAEEVEVILSRDVPEFVRGDHICARVVSSAGPWRRQGEWWADGQSSAISWQAHAPATYNRDYYEVALADGAVYRIYCDLVSGRWFVDGIYD